MTRGWIIFAVLFAAATALYVAIVAWSLPVVSSGADGLLPFDMRPMGYSEDEARTFMLALTPQASEHYRGTQQILDTAYPILLGCTFALGFWLFLDEWRWARWATMLLAVALTGWDLLENFFVVDMLRSGALAASADQIERASFATVMKSIFTALAWVLLAILAVLFVRRKFRT
ncbi:MAG: hypothetical protein AAF636_03935 [Pseudomonadota bacterium]